jgi:peptidoglycan/LPS O-acetylase OafA/YrhL
MKRYEVLDGMRGVAAISVMLMHASEYLDHDLLPQASIAVDFFFVLSGFVIAHAYGERASMGLAKFMSRRMVRLYPMYLVGLIAGVPMLLLFAHQRLTDYSPAQITLGATLNAAYLPFFNSGHIFNNIHDAAHGTLFPANGPAWSLSFEIAANLCFFWIYRIGLRGLRWLLALSYAGLVLTGGAVALAHGRLGLELMGGWATDNFINGIPRVFYGFSLGVALYLLARGPLFARLEAMLAKADAGMYLLFGALVLMFAAPSFQHDGLYYLIMIGAPVPLLVFVGAALPCRTPFNLNVARVLGDLSYPLYCLHFPILRGVQLAASKGYDFFGLPQYAVTSLISLLAALIVCRFYDEPLRAWLTRRLARTPAQPPALTQWPTPNAAGDVARGE